MFGGVVGFSSSKVKTALKLLAGRINLVSNKKKAALKLLNAEVAGLLAANKHDSARIREEAVLREERLLAAWELLSLFLELLSQRLSNLERSRCGRLAAPTRLLAPPSLLRPPPRLVPPLTPQPLAELFRPSCARRSLPPCSCPPAAARTCPSSSRCAPSLAPSSATTLCTLAVRTTG